MLRRLHQLVIAFGAMLLLSAASSAQCIGDDSVPIGAYGPITGPAAIIGLGGRDGINLAVKEINEAGGVTRVAGPVPHQ